MTKILYILEKRKRFIKKLINDNEMLSKEQIITKSKLHKMTVENLLEVLLMNGEIENLVNGRSTKYVVKKHKGGNQNE